MGRVRRTVSVVGLAVAVSTWLATSASATDVANSAKSWPQAAAMLGTAGSLWEPVSPLKLRQARPIDVVADQLQFTEGRLTSGRTYAGTSYGTSRRGFTIQEHWTPTDWAKAPVSSPRRAPVGVVRLGIGEAGARTAVDAHVFANCFPQRKSGTPRPVPAGFRCKAADVLKWGGSVELTAVPGSANAQQGSTDVVITSKGLTVQQLLMVARSLHQAASGPGLGAGSAEMVALCRQMTGMSVDAATELATAGRYIVRVGTVDGQPQALTTDFRPDRFTLAVEGGKVSSCTYG